MCLAYQSGSKTINGLNIIDGKVDGKIPLAEYKKYRVDSVHNIDSDTMTLGKYEPTIRQMVLKIFQFQVQVHILLRQEIQHILVWERSGIKLRIHMV